MASYTLSPQAYALPILHAAAHPSSTVLGLLLASGSEITDALPLVHRYTSLSPTTELGLALARAHADKEGKRVVGVYVALGEGEGLGRAGGAVLKSLGEGAVGISVSTAVGSLVENTTDCSSTMTSLQRPSRHTAPTADQSRSPARACAPAR